MRTKVGNGHPVNVDQFLEDIKTVVRDGEQLLKAGVSSVREKALARVKVTDRTVRKYPYQTLGIVFSLGVVVGILATGMFTGSEEAAQD
jgi:ElaB/YqjD/DUF883 family membrane-anchored ribosome-binding protein